MMPSIPTSVQVSTYGSGTYRKENLIHEKDQSSLISRLARLPVQPNRISYQSSKLLRDYKFVQPKGNTALENVSFQAKIMSLKQLVKHNQVEIEPNPEQNIGEPEQNIGEMDTCACIIV